MFLNILRISASNVLKMFLNIVDSTGCTFVIFQLHKYALLLISRYPGQQESDIIINKLEVIADQCSAFDLFLKNREISCRNRSCIFFH